LWSRLQFCKGEALKMLALVHLILHIYHLITVASFALITYHCLYISLQT